MSLSIGQIAAASYEAVLNDSRKPENQWAESAFMSELDDQGAIVEKDFGKVLEVTLDYRRNQGAKFLASDMEGMSTAKTEVLTAAQYAIAQLGVPVRWSKLDDVQTPSKNAKVAFVDTLLNNGFDSHDDMIEEAFFVALTQNFLGLPTIIDAAGTGTVGGIDSGVETFWRCVSTTYTDDTDIEAALTTSWNTQTKGTGSRQTPTWAVSDGATLALFEGTQTPLRRYETQDIKAGARTIMFKTARWVFSQYAGTSVYMGSPKSLKLYVSRDYFRDRGETKEIDAGNAFEFQIYSALQLATGNRSRLSVTHL